MVAASVDAARHASALAALGGAGVAVLLAALVLGHAGAVLAAIVVLGSDYAGAVLLSEEEVLDAGAPLHAAGLLAVAELALWSLELRGAPAPDRRSLAWRAALLGALVLLSIVLGAVVLVVARVPVRGSVAWDAVGVAAAALLLATLARLARQQR